MLKLSHIAVAGLAGLLAGCQREQIQSYQVPKEDYTVKVAAASSGGAQQQVAHPHWGELPKGWEERSEAGRAATFRVTDGDEKFAEIRIVPLRGVSGINDQVINMWRSQELGLPELPTNAPTKGVEIEVGPLKGELFDITSAEPRFLGKYKARITAVILPRDGVTWFIKMSGEESLVAREQDAFRTFIKNLEFHDGSHDEPQVAAASHNHDHEHGEHEPHPETWKAPASWKKLPTGQMLLASYQAGESGNTADITVSAFPGDVGGLLGNVNRWRSQVGLGPIQAGDLAKETRSIDLPSGEKAIEVKAEGSDLESGKTKAVYGLVVRRGSKTWFFKMLGAPAVVKAEQENLAKFVPEAH